MEMKTIEMTYTKRKQLDNVYQREGSLPPLEYTSKEDYSTIWKYAITISLFQHQKITRNTWSYSKISHSNPLTSPLTSNILGEWYPILFKHIAQYSKRLNWNKIRSYISGSHNPQILDPKHVDLIIIKSWIWPKLVWIGY